MTDLGLTNMSLRADALASLEASDRQLLPQQAKSTRCLEHAGYEGSDRVEHGLESPRIPSQAGADAKRGG